MAVKLITKTAVEGLKPGTAIWDAQIKGFGVRRQMNGAVYVFKYTLQGRQRFATSGPHGSRWSAETARKQAKQLAGEIAKGVDVAARRKAVDPLGDLARELFGLLA